MASIHGNWKSAVDELLRMVLPWQRLASSNGARDKQINNRVVYDLNACQMDIETKPKKRKVRCENGFVQSSEEDLRKSAIQTFNTDKTYNIILADPPWKFKDENREIGARRKYDTLELDDLKKLPVAGLAKEDAVLFLWTTNATVMDAGKLVEAWGFRFVTVFLTWVKMTQDFSQVAKLKGNYTRTGTELLIMGHRGLFSRYTQDCAVSSVLHAKRPRPVKHSKKPGQVFEIIRQVFGDFPCIELFARTPRPGWDGWGKEYGKLPEGLPLNQEQEKLVREVQEENSKHAYAIARMKAEDFNPTKKPRITIHSSKIDWRWE